MPSTAAPTPCQGSRLQDRCAHRVLLQPCGGGRAKTQPQRRWEGRVAHICTGIFLVASAAVSPPSRV